MRTLTEEIATQENGRLKVQFGRVIIGEFERYYIRVNDEIATFRPDVMASFLAKINAYITRNDTLIGTIHKSGISSGNADTSQIADFQPLEQPPVRSADFTRGVNP